MTRQNTVGAMLLGGFVGVAIGLLFAPRSGKETRSKIREKAGEIKHEADEKLQHGRAQIQKGIERAKNAKDRLTNKTEENISSSNQRSPLITGWEEEV